MKKIISILLVAVFLLATAVPAFAVTVPDYGIGSSSIVVDTTPGAILRIIAARLLNFIQQIERALQRFLNGRPQPAPAYVGEVITPAILRLHGEDIGGTWVLVKNEYPAKLVFFDYENNARYTHTLPLNWDGNNIKWQMTYSRLCMTLIETEQKQTMSFCYIDVLNERRHIPFYAQAELDRLNVSGINVSFMGCLYIDMTAQIASCAVPLPSGGYSIKVSDLQGVIIPEDFNTIEDLGGKIYAFDIEGTPGNYHFIVG